MIHIKFKKGDYAEQLDLLSGVLEYYPDHIIRTKNPGHFSIEVVPEQQQALLSMLHEFGFTALLVG